MSCSRRRLAAWDARRGLLLPAPGTASWDLTVPAAGELQFSSGLVEPEIRTGAGSDGAKVVVEVEVQGQPAEQVFTTDLSIRNFEPHRVDLSKWVGKPVRLRIKSEPGATTEAQPEAAGAALHVEVRDGQPVGGVEELTVTSGDDVRIEVSVDAPQEIHVHGYDLEAEATPDAPAVIELTADLEGVFDIESHTSEALLARLVVEP